MHVEMFLYGCFGFIRALLSSCKVILSFVFVLYIVAVVYRVVARVLLYKLANLF